LHAAQPPPPHRPFAMRVLNRAGGALARSGLALPRLDEERLLARARRQARLDDFGPATFRPGLRRLIESLAQDAALNQVGRLSARQQILELLVHRLRLAEHRRRHPEIADEKVERPLFILGLPRSGTSLLHALLAADPAHRAPLMWEVDDPCPPPEASTSATDPRIERCERRFAQVRSLAPGFQAIHPLGARVPQECIAFTALEFLSLRFEMSFDVHGYQAWLLRQDMRPAYACHRRFLQHLQSRVPTGRWVLKSPGHLGPIEALFAEYPDALVVQTHRDPLKVIPSVASLEYTMRCAGSDAVDAAAVGAQQLVLWPALLEQGIAARERHPEWAERFVDVHYREIAADPIACAQRIYARFGLPWTAEGEAAMRGYLAAHPRDEFGAHRYSLEMFGLDAAAVARRFGRYSERFGVEAEAD
jgi:hypothetical protein